MKRAIGRNATRRKILKLARTIADLAGHDDIDAEDVAEAVQYRNLDRGVMG
jgi:magnesium chelatase family protein